MRTHPSSRRYDGAMRLVLPALLLLAACGGDDSSGAPDATPYGSTWEITGTLDAGDGCPDTLDLVVEGVDTTPAIVGRAELACDPVVRSTNDVLGLYCEDAAGENSVEVAIAADGFHAGTVHTVGAPCSGFFDVTAMIEGE